MLSLRQFLTEGSDYVSMLKPFLDIEQLRNPVTEQITWAKSNLKKQDRVVWYLKIVRLYFALYADQIANDRNKTTYTKYVNDFNSKIKSEQWNRDKGFRKLLKLDGFNSLRAARKGWESWIENLQSQLSNYLDSNNAKIDAVVFSNQLPRELFNTFDDKEVQNFDKRCRLIPVDELDSKVKEIIKFSNTLGWFDLGVGVSTQEGNSMGHCGNNNHLLIYKGDRMYSLRESIQKDGKEYQKPLLTIVLDKDGYITDCRAFGNTKPGEEFRKYIIPFLKQKIVNGFNIYRIGLVPDALNSMFFIYDLSDEQYKEVEKANPNAVMLYGKDDESFLQDLESYYSRMLRAAQQYMDRYGD